MSAPLYQRQAGTDLTSAKRWLIAGGGALLTISLCLTWVLVVLHRSTRPLASDASGRAVWR